MPLLFIHGVNNRAGPEYEAAESQRNEMYQKVLLPTVRVKYPDLSIIRPDVYWGKLGVQYRWKLASMFGKPLGAMGREVAVPDDESAPSFMALLSLADKQQFTGAATDDYDSMLQEAAQVAPAALVRALLAPERSRFEPKMELADKAGATGTEEADKAKANRTEEAKRDGRQSALLLIAAEEVARDDTFLKTLQLQKGGEAIVNAILSKIQERFKAQLPPVQATAGQGLPMGKAEDWVFGRLKELGDATMSGAKQTVNYIKGCGTGAIDQAKAVVLNLPGGRSANYLRENVGKNAALFFGDVFEYLRRGTTVVKDQPCIASVVRDAVLNAAARRKPTDPLIIVAHSFGGMIFYDLLTAPDPGPHLRDLEGEVDLLVTVGSQVSLFAEMQMYRNNPAIISTGGKEQLPKPPKVKAWINVFDTSDLFSFHAEPVFGTAVKDIPMQGNNAVVKAHSAYFAEPAFYEEIAKALP